MGMRVAGLVLVLSLVFALSPLAAQPGPLPRSTSAVQPAGTCLVSQTLSAPIPDNDCSTGLSGTFNLNCADAAGEVITSVILGVDMDHARKSDLIITLSHLGATHTVWNRGTGWFPGEWTLNSSVFDGQLVNGSWTIRIRDCVAGVTGSLLWWSVQASYCPPPQAPWNPAPADGATGRTVDADLNWSDSDNATGYDVYFGTTSPPPKIASTTVSQYALPTLLCYTRYYWRIVATADCGASTSGPVWDFTTVCCPPEAPSAPSPAHRAEGVSRNVDLDWADALYAAEYDVYFGPDYPPPKVGTTSSSAWTLPTLSTGTSYKWRVVTRSACGETSSPDWWFATCTYPGSVTGPSPADGATSRPLTVDLDWADVSGATSYDVYLGSPTPYKIGSSATSAFELFALASDTLYNWKVVAVNVCGETAGPVWSFRTCRKPDMPWSPAPADGATGRSVTANLNWDDVDAATSYDVYFGTYAGPPKVATTTVSSYDPGVLAFGQRYYWEIVARNACGDTSGPMWEFTTRAASSKVVLPLVRRP